MSRRDISILVYSILVCTFNYHRLYFEFSVLNRPCVWLSTQNIKMANLWVKSVFLVFLWGFSFAFVCARWSVRVLFFHCPFYYCFFKQCFQVGQTTKHNAVNQRQGEGDKPNYNPRKHNVSVQVLNSVMINLCESCQCRSCVVLQYRHGCNSGNRQGRVCEHRAFARRHGAPFKKRCSFHRRRFRPRPRSAAHGYCFYFLRCAL